MASSLAGVRRPPRSVRASADQHLLQVAQAFRRGDFQVRVEVEAGIAPALAEALNQGFECCQQLVGEIDRLTWRQGPRARTQGGREPQRGWMPREDSRPTEDNARSGLENGVPAFPDRLAWGLDTRKSPTAQDRSACLRLFETTSRRPVSPRPAPIWLPARSGNSEAAQA